jgi:hypothetical protein
MTKELKQVLDCERTALESWQRLTAVSGVLRLRYCRVAH